MIERQIATTVHGRFLHEERDPARLLVGFHGYAETADVSLAEMGQIPGIDAWSVVAVQALHPFYPKQTRIGASWMTALNRETAIADNINYVRAVLASLPKPRQLVFLGFSQGASMAARAAVLAGANPAGLIMLGGDIPPELDPPSMPPVLLARGQTDDWYSAEKFEKDLRFLKGRAEVTPLVFAGGHEWTDEFRATAGEFLRKL